MNNSPYSSLRTSWSHLFQFNWKLGVVLILLFGIPRFILVLHSYVTRNYMLVMFIFLLMWFVPFILLSKTGRKGIGIRRPIKFIRLFTAFLSGLVGCAIIFNLFKVSYGGSIHNAFVYIGGNNPGASIANPDRWIYFIIAVMPSMIFSPIGEEFFYRGVVHGCFASTMSETRASFFDSLAFALTHIAHFGIIWNAGVWHFALIPTLLGAIHVRCQSIILSLQAIQREYLGSSRCPFRI